MTRLALVHGSKSDQGRRASNDDCVLVDAEAGIYLVCDGARGRFGGRTAAELAVETIQRALAAGIPLEGQEEMDWLLFSAHESILAAQQQDPALEGMTSTAAMVLHRGSELLLSHVGDTRIYLHREGKLQQMTTDHNLENYLRANPHIQPKRNVSGKTLVRALGLKSSNFTVDHTHLSLRADDVLLISTDGLSDSVPEPTIAFLLGSLRIQSEAEVAAALTRSALNHGSMDNVSTIVLHVIAQAPTGGGAGILEGSAATKRVDLGWLAFLDGPRRVVPLEANTLIGADPGCRIALRDDHVSVRHAEVLRTEHGFFVRDLGSTNGTFINNVKVNEAYLVDGDLLRVGHSELTFKSHRIEE
jgi:serine/threonine protein phosphatase PrpC